MVDVLGLVASVVYVDVDVDIFLHRMVKLAAGRATRVHVISLYSPPPVGLGSVRQSADV